MDTASSVSRPDHCVAVRTQIDVYDWEDSLYREARIAHPRVAWWWGQKIGGPRIIAVCYICDAKMVKWARNYPMTRRAKQAIEDHKFTHRADLIRVGRTPHNSEG